MANLHVRNFPDDLMNDLRIAAIRAKMDLKDFVPQIIAEALKTSNNKPKDKTR